MFEHEISAISNVLFFGTETVLPSVLFIPPMMNVVSSER